MNSVSIVLSLVLLSLIIISSSSNRSNSSNSSSSSSSSRNSRSPSRLRGVRVGSRTAGVGKFWEASTRADSPLLNRGALGFRLLDVETFVRPSDGTIPSYFAEQSDKLGVGRPQHILIEGWISPREGGSPGSPRISPPGIPSRTHRQIATWAGSKSGGCLDKSRLCTQRLCQTS